MTVIQGTKDDGRTELERFDALSIKQPWASLIVLGYKDIENRTWRTKLRGRFYVQASKLVDQREIRACRALIERSAHLRDRKDIEDVLRLDYLRANAGGIIGYATIVDCVDDSVSPWFVGPRGFVLHDAKPLNLVPMSGRLGFFSLADCVIRDIKAQGSP